MPEAVNRNIEGKREDEEEKMNGGRQGREDADGSTQEGTRSREENSPACRNPARSLSSLVCSRMDGCPSSSKDTIRSAPKAPKKLTRTSYAFCLNEMSNFLYVQNLLW